ncbi:MAG: epimerase [Actinobacteria bacterium]|uniref:Unannotated protein n=1 Tax=freshwater metagenome TaxID=449393 RepID=A0A6J6NYU3_9ZZZZ|nr:epimerase [Actinomycetota bacterium]
MRILVLGGSVFLSRAVAADAVARGHDVTCLCRSADVPDGARHLAWDRSTGAAPPDVGDVDAVVDVARHPSWLRTAVAAWPDAHWTFVSTINVYVDESTPHGTPATLALRDPEPEDRDLSVDMEAYGPMKVACEDIVRAGVERAFVVRPGLIVGPGDPTGRFTYWPARIADGGEILAGGSPDDVVQVIDVRDLAAWIVGAVEAGTTGDVDGVGPAMPFGDLLAQLGAGTVTWLADDVLESAEVAPWSGPRSLPLWLPRPAYDGMLAHDWTPSRDAGLRVRPLAETGHDTLAWLRATPGAVVTGLTREEEAEVIAQARA